MRTSILSSRLVLTGAALATTAVVFGSVVPGCGTDTATPSFAPENDPYTTEVAAIANDQTVTVADDSADALRRVFPDHAAVVLDQETKFIGQPAGYWQRWGASVSPSVGSFGVMDVFLPKHGNDAIRLVLGDGFEVRVREIGAEGQGRSAANAIVYARAGGTSFWTAATAGAEEWLHLAAEYVRSDVPVVAWDIEGGTLRLMDDGDRAAIVDKAGVARIWVTAPEAFTANGEPVKTSFEAEGNRLSLYVDTEGEEVLVDPMWTTAAPMATGRAFGVAIVLQNGKVLVTAGNNGAYFGSAELYDPATNTWTAAGTAYPSAGHQVGLLQDGRVISVGGYDGVSCLSTVKFYDPNTNLWTTAPSLITARCIPRIAVLPDGRVIVAGGSAGSTSLSATEIYNPATNAWTSAAPLLTARRYHSVVLLNDGRVLAAGGIGALTTAEIYNPATNAWSSAGSLITGRSEHTLTLLADGRAIAIGGFNSSAAATATADIYSPITNSWSSAPSMSSARTSHSANRLGSGSVLVAGGYITTSTVLASAELFDPTTNTWSVAPSMTTARYSAGAALLQNGKVLVTSGRTGSSTYTATTTLFSNGVLGDGCAQATDCVSGFCADGVCCNSTCGAAGDCQMCNAPGSVGTCIFAPAATVCRASTSTCDAAEMCDGVNLACPANALAVAGTTCRVAIGVCDVAETCTGLSATCPADALAMKGSVCRASASACDAPEVCTGLTETCPNNAVFTEGTPCRMSAGICDVTESCNGTSSLCPTDQFVEGGTECRGAIGPCDFTEACSGMAADCPIDNFSPAGTLCDDGNPCSLADSCNGALCAGMPLDCSAKDECHDDGACNPATGACLASPPKADGTPCAGGKCESGTCSTSPSGSSSGAGGSAGSGSAGAGGSVGEGGSAGEGGAGGGVPASEGDCGCRVVGASEHDKAPWMLLGMALIGAFRGRWRLQKVVGTF